MNDQSREPHDLLTRYTFPTATRFTGLMRFVVNTKWPAESGVTDERERFDKLSNLWSSAHLSCRPWLVLSRHSSFEGGKRHNVHRPQLRVCLPYMPYGRIRWISVCHLLVLSPSATWQLQMQRPCRWPLSMCECTAGLWSLFLFLETWRRNSTYLLVPTWKHLFFTH